MKEIYSQPKNWREEYKHFLLHYLLPIIGISFDNNIETLSDTHTAVPSSKNAYIRQEGKRVVFSTYKWDIFEMFWAPEISEDSLMLAKRIIPVFFHISKYKLDSSSVSRNYVSDQIREENYYEPASFGS